MERAPQPASSRQQILMTQDQATALERLAERESVSKSEIVRRALAGYRGESAIEDEEAAAVLRELSETLDRAIDTVATTVAELREGRERHNEQLAAERARVAAWAEAHPDAMDALARALRADETDRGARAWG